MRACLTSPLGPCQTVQNGLRFAPGAIHPQASSSGFSGIYYKDRHEISEDQYDTVPFIALNVSIMF